MNYYEILGVPENATEKEIKKAYKTLVKKYHPDVFDGNKTLAEKKIKEFNEAYEILSDSESRSKYDTSLYSEPVIELRCNDETTENKDIIKNYDSTTFDMRQKRDLYENARVKYTTNYYGVSRDDLKKEKEYSRNKAPDYFIYKHRLIIILSISVIIFLLLLIFLLSTLQNIIDHSTITNLI